MSQTLSPASVQAGRPTLLDGRTVAVIGGTSGIGLAAATRAKGAGADVIVIGLERDRAQHVATEHGFAGRRAADVTQPETIQEALADIMTGETLHADGSVRLV